MKQTEYFKLLKDFCQSTCDRFGFIHDFAVSSGLPVEIISFNNNRFIKLTQPNLCAVKKGALKKIFVAHYDRAAGSPGANDNSAAVIQLLLFIRELAGKRITSPLEFLFTDREEINDGQPITSQGSFQLGKLLKNNASDRFASFHFDMCGRGDSIVVSLAGEQLLERRQKTTTTLYKKMKILRTAALEMIPRFFRGRLLLLPTPFSDNLGFLLQGISSLQFTLLPFQEAYTYDNEYKKMIKELTGLRNMNKSAREHWKEHLASIQPETWRLRHSANDTVETLDGSSRVLMNDFFYALARCALPSV